jgi:tetratricopeptide (TPR) repeat protein
MVRSDHSMLPPTPAATMAFGSPNACNLCHTDQDAAWSDRYVREWFAEDYQAPVLYRGGLIAAARQDDWSRSSEMIRYLASAERNEIFAASLIRLLARCGDEGKWSALRAATQDPSPLVRAAAVNGLESVVDDQSAREVLLAALTDDYRLVRVSAASALTACPRRLLTAAQAERLDSARHEYLTMLDSRPDDSMSQYNLGNFRQLQGDRAGALAAYQRSIQLDPVNVLPQVNLAMLHATAGELGKAEEALRRAVKHEPDSIPANFNLGLLSAEKGDLQAAESFLRKALKSDPTLSSAAYNLAVIVAGERPGEAVELCRQAVRYGPGEPKYAYTLAFYQLAQGDMADAVVTLEGVLAQHPDHLESTMLLGDIHERAGQWRDAVAVYQRALDHTTLPVETQAALRARISALGANHAP